MEGSYLPLVSLFAFKICNICKKNKKILRLREVLGFILGLGLEVHGFTLGEGGGG